jgi:signal transduction histidine kinase
MNEHLLHILNTLQENPDLSAEQKESALKALKAADKELQILSFKLDRTEKVKRTTAILLEETIEELEQKRKAVEEALTELKATQAQLVQQEKLASLGQLTAGIAHEIKNPLNFVNNFSEVSLELVEEIREEIRQVTEDRGPGSEKAKVKSEKSPLEGSAEAERRRGVSDETTDKAMDSDLIIEILDDIEANLKKIHEHGSRADSIVKSMLMHSRGGDGKPEPTSLNPLIKEYVNLAFHGMRAGKEAINVDIDLQLDESVGEVPLIAEDFSRVILNLCNNSFDAMRGKMTGNGGQGTGNPNDQAPNSKRYSPKLTVRTKSAGNTITIEIEDNGPGIPDEIKDKIMQPFFTTKKGTQGTGLGLSITNDIVKAHGGELTVTSQTGTGTTFMIKLPKMD